MERPAPPSEEFVAEARRRRAEEDRMTDIVSEIVMYVGNELAFPNQSFFFKFFLFSFQFSIL